MTFGYGRVEVVAALINYTTLIVIGLYLLFEAAMRFADPQPVEGWLIVIIAGSPSRPERSRGDPAMLT